MHLLSVTLSTLNYKITKKSSEVGFCVRKVLVWFEKIRLSTFLLNPTLKRELNMKSSLWLIMSPLCCSRNYTKELIVHEELKCSLCPATDCWVGLVFTLSAHWKGHWKVFGLLDKLLCLKEKSLYICVTHSSTHACMLIHTHTPSFPRTFQDRWSRKVDCQ